MHNDSCDQSPDHRELNIDLNIYATDPSVGSGLPPGAGETIAL